MKKSLRQILQDLLMDYTEADILEGLADFDDEEENRDFQKYVPILREAINELRDIEE